MADRFEIRVKRLLDQLPHGSVERLHDGGVAAEGYKPDRVYRGRNRIWVVEIESTTSRKGFIGGYVKAQKYFQDAREGPGCLLFIINEAKRNLDSVAAQVSHYHEWLKLQKVSVQPTYFMYDTPLVDLVNAKTPILSAAFLTTTSRQVG